jgi:hypothetical protein
MAYHGVDAAETLDAATARWQTLSDDAVAKEIACYRVAAVAALSEARANGGDCASDEELELADEEAPEADADDEDAAIAAGAAAGGDDGGVACIAEQEADGGAYCFARVHVEACRQRCCLPRCHLGDTTRMLPLTHNAAARRASGGRRG